MEPPKTDLVGRRPPSAIVAPQRSSYPLKLDRHASHALIARSLSSDRRRRRIEGAYAVLDIGCGPGPLAEWLHSPQFHVTGVEGDVGAIAGLAGRYDRGILADIEALPALTLDRPPDALVLANVLEHLREPGRALRHFASTCLAPGGLVIVAVPNVAHFAMRLSLLLGRFDYQDAGIRDRAHLRFFTLRTALTLCREASIAVESVSATPLPLPSWSPRFAEGGALHPVHAASAAVARRLPALLGYELVLAGLYRPA